MDHIFGDDGSSLDQTSEESAPKPKDKVALMEASTIYDDINSKKESLEAITHAQHASDVIEVKMVPDKPKKVAKKVKPVPKKEPIQPKKVEEEPSQVQQQLDLGAAASTAADWSDAADMKHM